MRLIDADALKYELFADNYNTKMTNQEVADCIDNSPTIDTVPVVRGEWKTNSNYPDKLICSVCGYKEDMWWADKGTHYCPNCGAKNE